MMNVQVCYSTDEEHVAFDTHRTSGQAMAFLSGTIKTMWAHDELLKTRERTMRGTLMALRDGYFVNSEAPFGFVRCLVDMATRAFVCAVPKGQQVRMQGHGFSVRVDEAEFTAVRVIFDGVIARKSFAQIVRELNDGRYPTPAEGPWQPQRIKEIVTNPLYMGDYVFGRRFGGEPVPHTRVDCDSAISVPVIHRGFVTPAPISPERWALANDVITAREEKRTQVKASHPRYLLSRILVCARCGSGLYGHRQAERQGVGRVVMYRHPAVRSGRPDCPFVNRYLHAAPLEEAARDATLKYLESTEVLELARRALAQLREGEVGDDTAAAIRTAEVRVREARAAAVEANVRAARATSAADKLIHADTVVFLTRELEDTEAHLAHLQQKAAALEAAAAQLPKMELDLETLRQAYLQGSADDQKRVVNEVIEHMQADLRTDTIHIRIRAA